MSDANHTLEDEFWTRDRVRHEVVERILTEGLCLPDTCDPSQILEDLLLDLHASSQDHRSFES